MDFNLAVIFICVSIFFICAFRLELLERWLRADDVERFFSTKTRRGNLANIVLMLVCLIFIWVAPVVFNYSDPDGGRYVSEFKVRMSRIILTPICVIIIAMAVRRVILIK